jgi:hypothetical protein
LNIITQKLFMGLRLYDKNMNALSLQKNSGYITLLSVLISSAIAVSITISIVLLGLASSRNSFSVEQSNQAKALADSCAEEALQEIRDSDSYSGSSSLSLGQGTCSYTVTSGSGENKNIEAYGTVGTIVRKVEIDLNQLNPTLEATSWQDVEDF